jgi:hypothetical protein
VIVLLACQRDNSHRVAVVDSTLAAAPQVGFNFDTVATRELDTTRLVVNDLRIGSGESVIRGRLGVPDSVSTPILDELSGDTVVSWYYQGAIVLLGSSRLVGLECNVGCATGDGISIGSSEWDVVRAYGRPHVYRSEPRHVLAYAAPAYACGVEFEFSTGRVVMIALRCYD